jgi:REP element-mobilizing transposase RayT
VTISVLAGLVSLRRPTLFAALQDALALAQRRWFHIVHFSVQRDHLHLVVETSNKGALSRGVKGVSVRIARAYNRGQKRRGAVIRDRYHARDLANPRQVRTVLVYVLQNWRKARPHERALDDKSSAAWFDGWDDTTREALWGWAADRTRGSPWQYAPSLPKDVTSLDSRTRRAVARRARAAGRPLAPVVSPTTALLGWLWRTQGGGPLSMHDAPRIPAWDAFVPTRR